MFDLLMSRLPPLLDQDDVEENEYVGDYISETLQCVTVAYFGIDVCCSECGTMGTGASSSAAAAALTHE